MSSNVGLSTPRGSGTSGYVQRNLSHFRPRDPPASSPYGANSQDSKLQDNKYRQRQPDQQILNHDRLREIEVKVFELRDRLEDEGISESEVETQTSALRAKLTSVSNSSSTTSANGTSGSGKTQLKPHQVHELAAAKIEESENFRRALGIRGDYEEGSHWKRQRDEERNGDRDGDGGEEKEKEKRRDTGRDRDRDGGEKVRERERERGRERRW